MPLSRQEIDFQGESLVAKLDVKPPNLSRKKNPEIYTPTYLDLQYNCHPTIDTPLL